MLFSNVLELIDLFEIYYFEMHSFCMYFESTVFYKICVLIKISHNKFVKNRTNFISLSR